MTISTTKNGTEITLALEGRLDTVTAPELDAEIQKIDKDIRLLVIDMGDLEYVSSAGLRVLLNTQKRMNEQKGEMKVIKVKSEIMEIFEVTGFDEILTIE